MKPEIKQLWIEALESGEYKQGKGYLCSLGASGQRLYCCLGVLSELAVKAGVIEPGVEADYNHVDYDGMDTWPSEQVEAWSGLHSVAEQSALARRNDNGNTFEEIAQYIRENL